MPQLLSRLDNAGWLTPSVAEVLDALPPLPYDEKFRREQAVTLQKTMHDLGIPGRVVRVGVFPPHTLYVILPGGTRRLGVGPTVSVQDIARRLPEFKEVLHAKSVGMVPALRRSPNHVGLLVRMAENHALRLRNVLLMPAYQSTESNTALAFGLDLNQQVVVHDLADLPHLLIMGAADAAGRTLRTVLLNLLLLNTPSELRIALMSPGDAPITDDLEILTRLPHVLGHRLRDEDESLKLLDGLVKECERRQRFFTQQGVKTLAEYNTRVEAQQDQPLPRIVIVLEHLLDQAWLDRVEDWFDLVRKLLANGPAMGIHLLLTAYTADHGALPGFVEDLLTHRLLVGAMDDRHWPHETPLPVEFMDGYFLESGTPTPLIFGEISDAEVERTVAYWQRIVTQRINEHQTQAESEPDAPAEESAQASEPLADKPKLPIPPPPSPSVLVRAADVLTSQDVRRSRAAALAAYLGWLGVGPLQDVLGFTEAQAHDLLNAMQADGLLEPGDGPIWRFARLDQGEDDTAQ
jgi:hypothetical protein